MSATPTLQRLPGWPERLHAFLADALACPFAWAEHDCCHFAAQDVQALTGQDLLAPWRGRYRTRAGALRLLRQLGGLRAAVASVLGAPDASVAQAWRGDLVLVSQAPGHELLAVWEGPWWCAPGPGGLVQRQGGVVAVWRIGHA